MSAAKVILDTNFLLIPSKFPMNIFEEIESALNRKVDPLILSSTLDELRRMASSRSTRIQMASSLALELAKKCRLIKVELGKKRVNDMIVQKARELGCLVATNDRELIGRLRREGIPVIFLRQRRRLVAEGHIP